MRFYGRKINMSDELNRLQNEQKTKKKKEAQIAFLEIEKAMEKIKQDFPNEFNFWWDECIWVDGEFFASKDDIFQEVDIVKPTKKDIIKDE